GEKRLAFRLVSRILSNKIVNRETFIRLMPTFWRTVDEVETKIVSGNTFFFTFKSATDLNRVLHGGPWIFDKSLLVLEKPIGKGDIQEMAFNTTAFWVQIHHIPLLCRTKKIGIFLGGLIGEVQEIDTSST
ncbi:hypothetical protein Ddye_016607, partial [Dipteronia dyeriana]